MDVYDTVHDERLEQDVTLARSAGGAEVALARTPGFATRAGHFGLRFGSADTRFRVGDAAPREVPDGSAHFLEHKLFEGREEKVFDRFARLGAQFNGGTGFQTTTYYFSTAQHFEECVEVLLDFVQHPLITDERVEKERGIIEQEVRMYEDHPGFRGLFLLHRALYENLPIRVSPGGRVEDVHRISADDLQACFDAFYRPRRLRLSLAGDFDPEEMMAFVEPLLGTGDGAPVERLPPEEPSRPAHARLEEAFHVTRPHLWIGWRDAEGVGLGAAQLRRRLLSALALELAFDVASPIHEDLYAREIIDDSFGAQYHGDADWGYAMLSVETERPEECARELVAAAERFAAEGPDPADFERTRRAAWGQAVSGVQTPGALAGTVLRALLDEQRPFAALSLLQEITCDDVAARAAEMFRPERRAEALLRPAS